jgi:hypothetical protein
MRNSIPVTEFNKTDRFSNFLATKKPPEGGSEKLIIPLKLL